MQHHPLMIASAAAILAIAGATEPATAATTVQIGTSGKTFASSVAQCVVNPDTGVAAPQVQAGLFNPKRGVEAKVSLNGTVNRVPLTQLSATRPHTPVFLRAGTNVISAANGSLSTDYYIRDGGTGACVL